MVGVVAWFWNARIRGILDQFRALPSERRRISGLEDLDFEHYVEIAAFLGWRPTIGRHRYDEPARSRPSPTLSAIEVEAEGGALAAALGYGSGDVVRPLPRVENVLVATRPSATDRASKHSR